MKRADKIVGARRQVLIQIGANGIRRAGNDSKSRRLRSIRDLPGLGAALAALRIDGDCGPIFLTRFPIRQAGGPWIQFLAEKLAEPEKNCPRF